MDTLPSAIAADPGASLGDRREVDLAARARQGDAAAFERLIELRLDQTFRTAMAILGDEADARDATQAIFIKAWQSLPSLRDPERFAAWYGRIVVNTCRTSLRGRRRRTVREIPASSIEGAALERSPIGDDEPSLRLARMDALERAFDRLSDPERVVVWLHYYEGRPLTEISALIDAPVSTVKSRLFTARRSLERGLEDEDR
jgi:RNA polymerase sigma-70 factor (ECF subfamily)